MSIYITTQNVDRARIASELARKGKVTLHDSTYGLTITQTEDGFTVTDETGGDAEALDLAAAFAVAADFLRNIEADQDTGWAQVLEVLAA